MIKIRVRRSGFWNREAIACGAYDKWYILLVSACNWGSTFCESACFFTSTYNWKIWVLYDL